MFGSLYSYAKYLELLIYSSSLYALSPDLCEHTIPPSSPPNSPLQPEAQPESQKPSTSTTIPKHMPTLPQNHTNLIRHFSISKATVSFSISRVEDIFDLKVPRLQIRFGGSASADDDNLYDDERERIRIRMKGKAKEEDEEDEKKKALRGEIRNWFQGVFDHLKKLVCFFPFPSYVSSIDFVRYRNRFL
jgi:1-phosphatidylinositol-3-phosphate 5-kinase